MKRVLIAAFCLAIAATGLAQHPNEDRGFVAEHAYDVRDVDSVNVFNGNLVVSIPLGPEYKVSDHLSYRLALHYNSHVWRYETYETSIDSYDVPYDPFTTSYQLIAFPIESFNAGLGWRFSLGKLLDGGDPDDLDNTGGWLYQSPDGADHQFVAYPPESFPQVTDDNSNLRLQYVDAGTRVVEFPDGTQHTFNTLQQQNGTWPVSFAGLHTWYLTAMRDRFGNRVTIQYSTSAGYPEIWQISDPARTNTAYFVDLPVGDGTVRTLDHVDTSSFGGATGRYSLSAQSASIPPGNGDSSGRTSVPVALLTAVTPPSGNPYTMTLNGGPAYDTSTSTSGELLLLTLPTLGSVGWTYDLMHFHRTVRPARSPAVDAPVVVATRTKYDPRTHPVGTPPGNDNQWIYGRFLGDAVTCPATIPNQTSGRKRQLTVWVTEPLTGDQTGNDDRKTTISYFSAYEYMADPGGDTCDANGWVSAEHGLPLTRKASRAGAPGDPVSVRYLSSEVRQNFDAAPAIVNWSGAGQMPESSGDAILRQTYVTYDLHCTDPAVPYYIATDATLNSTATYFNDDCPTCYSGTNFYGFDGYGHYRQESTVGNFPGSANFRTTFTNYNPTLSDSCPVTQRSQPAVWFLDTFTEHCVADEATARGGTLTGCSSLPNAFNVQTAFDANTGALTSRRTLLNTNPTTSSSDLLLTYGYDAAGTVTSEVYSGGDSAATYTITHAPVYDNAAHSGCSPLSACVVTRDVATYANGVVASDQQYDLSTLLLKTVTDSSGLATTYNYDNLNRIISMQTPGVPPTTYTYSDANGTSGFTPAKILSTTDASAYGIGKVQQEFQYDAFGRLWRRKSLLDDGTWNIAEDDYDVLGRKRSSSTQDRLTVSESSYSPSHMATFSNLDVFSRPRTTQAPDGSKTTFAYTGTRQVQRTVNMATGTQCGGETLAGNATTTEVHDAAGRLYSVTEPSGPTAAGQPCGSSNTTIYGYDARDHLVSVATGVQTRTFAYDGRGLLSSETHPEIGQSGGGTVTYTGYDARGHALGKRVGAAGGLFDVTYAYDPAERLTDVKDSGGTRTVKHFDFFGTSAAIGSRSRIQSAVRYNRIPAMPGDLVVTESYTYDSASGRPTHRDTLVEQVVGAFRTPFQTFAQDFTYDQLGALARLDYPVCTGQVICSGSGLQPVALTRMNGYLKSVGTWAPSITRNGDGSVFEVTQTASVKDTYTPDPTGMPRPQTISVSGTTTCTGGVAAVSGGGTIYAGGSANIQVSFTGTPPFTITWSDGHTDSGIATTSFTRPVTPQTTTRYTVTSGVDGNQCAITGSGSATVTVTTLSAPTALSATTQSNALQVLVQWSAVSSAGWYQVQRATRITANDWQNVGSRVTVTNYTDTFAGNSTPIAYLYRVVAGVTTNGTDSVSSPSNQDYATVATILFSDDPIVSGSTFVRGLHLAEVRHAVDAVRYAAGLAPMWTSYNALNGFVNASDDTAIRSALDQATNALIGRSITYTTAPASHGFFRVNDVQEIRSAVR